MTQSHASNALACALLRLARRRSSLSQTQLAKLAEAPGTMVSAHELDKRHSTFPTRLKLLKASGYEVRFQFAPLTEQDDGLQDRREKRPPRLSRNSEKPCFSGDSVHVENAE
jgi:DNA-binding XRE family transcriptional regulator